MIFADGAVVLPELILGVAVRITCNGVTVVQKLPQPFRHHHLYRVFKNKEDGWGVTHEEGFFTNKRDFIDRIQARVLANDSLVDVKYSTSPLYSEDLWRSQLIDLDFTNPERLKAVRAMGDNPFIHFESI